LRRTLVRYGRHRANIVELWHPASSGGTVPVVALLHGGFWKAPYTKRLMRGLARAVTDEGWAAWNIEYRRVGRFGGGGGWPATLADVGAALDGLARLPGIDLDRIVTCGHSAGGQLALWAAGRHRLLPGAPGAGPRVRMAGAVALAGVVDLTEGARLGLGDGAVAGFLGGGPDVHPDRYAVASPAALLPLGVPQVLVHGLEDRTVPPSMSERYHAAAVAAGDTDVAYLPLEGVSHMEVISPRSAAWPPLRDSLRRLLTDAGA
jgi:acetyl esterase/lipase